METKVETRSRSRSKTPGLEAMEKAAPKKKDPSVSVIEEEEIPSSQEPKITRIKKTRKSKIVTSDYSSDDVSPTPDSSRVSAKVAKKTDKEVKEKSVVSSTTTVVTSTTKIVTSTTDAEEVVSSQTTKASDETIKEQTQNIFGSMFNAIKTSTPIQLIKKSRRTVVTVDPAVAKDHPAYKEYKEAGEYWNKYPKTDYTYSELSPHRREIVDGFVAMPNMSRRSLEKFENRVENMIQKNPTQESFIRQRFLSRSYTQPKYSADLQYDSTDEVDLSEFNRKTVVKKDSLVARFFLFIINAFYACCYGVKRIFYRKEQNLYAATPIVKQQQRGLIGRFYDSLVSVFLKVTSKFYILLSSILYLDVWLLKSSTTTLENKKRKRFLLALLLLLPLLLLGGIYVYLDPPTSVYAYLASFSFSWPTLPKISFPSLPKFSFSWPSITWPAWLTFSWPSLSWPSFSLPSISWPSLSWPAWPTWLSFTWPAWLTFSWPTFSWPSISIPSISWPSFSFSLPSLPSLPSFGFDKIDFAKYGAYFTDSWDFVKLKLIAYFVQAKDTVSNILSEAQIVWNENFNSK